MIYIYIFEIIMERLYLSVAHFVEFRYQILVFMCTLFEWVSSLHDLNSIENSVSFDALR